MTIEILLGLQLIALGAVLVLLQRLLHTTQEDLRQTRGLLARMAAAQAAPQPGRESRAPAVAAPPAPADTGIWQVLRRSETGELAVEELVREGTPAWQRAFDARGVYLRRASDGRGGKIVEGVQ
jgi:hypothetical protein